MDKDLSVLKKEVSTLKKEKNRLEKKLDKLQDTLLEKEEQLLELRLQKRRVSKSRTLDTYLWEDSSTIKLMDEFETRENGKYKYIRMVIRGHYLYIEKDYYIPVVERLEGRRHVGDITMTQLKKNEDWELRTYARENYERYFKNKEIERGEILFFERPFLLRAQNSKNRTGYGSEFYGGIVYQGTLYGETTDYCIVGMEKS